MQILLWPGILIYKLLYKNTNKITIRLFSDFRALFKSSFFSYEFLTPRSTFYLFFDEMRGFKIILTIRDYFEISN